MQCAGHLRNARRAYMRTHACACPANPHASSPRVLCARAESYIRNTARMPRNKLRVVVVVRAGLCAGRRASSRFVCVCVVLWLWLWSMHKRAITSLSSDARMLCAVHYAKRTCDGVDDDDDARPRALHKTHAHAANHQSLLTAAARAGGVCAWCASVLATRTSAKSTTLSGAGPCGCTTHTRAAAAAVADAAVLLRLLLLLLYRFGILHCPCVCGSVAHISNGLPASHTHSHTQTDKRGSIYLCIQ